jgi:hypothetical protein
MTRPFDRREYYGMVNSIVAAISASMEKARQTLDSVPGMRFLPDFKLVQVHGIPYVEFIMMMDIDTETYFILHPDIKVTHKDESWMQELSEQENGEYSNFEILHADMINEIYFGITHLIESGRDIPLDEDDRYPDNLGSEKWFYYNNRIPFLYRLPQQIMQHQPNLPEFTYTGVRDGRTVQRIDPNPARRSMRLHIDDLPLSYPLPPKPL